MPRISTILLPLPLLAALACNKDNSSAPTPPPVATCKEVGAPELKETDVIATVKGQPVLAKEILDKVRVQEVKAQADYLGKVHQIREGALKNMVIERILEEEAKKANVASVDEYVRQQAEKLRKPMDDARLQALYKELVPAGDPPFEQVKMQLAQMAMQRDTQEAVGALMDRIISENQIVWSLPAPKLPRLDVSVDDDPMLGDKDAKVTIVEFSDFECPYCSKAAEAVHEVEKKYKGKVRIVFRDFPLSFHKGAKPAAVAANCAKEQNKFWEFHDQLFKNQKGLDEGAFKTFARVVGMDGEKFDKCLTSNTYASEVEKDMADGEKLGVEGTPSFFVNGRPLTAGGSVEELSKAIDAALAEAG